MNWWKEDWGRWLFTQIKGASILVEEDKISAVCIYKKDLEYVIKNGPHAEHYEKLEALMKEKSPFHHGTLWVGFEWLKEEHEIGLKTTDVDFFNKHFKKRAVTVIKNGSYLVEVTDDL
jgi:hypothetical protein